MDIKIRTAKPEDVTWMIPELRKFAAFSQNKYNLFPEDETYIRKNFENLILNHIVLVAESFNAEGTAEGIGFIAGMYSAHAFNPAIQTFLELFFWVKEERRNCRAGALLLNEYLRIGKETANWIVFTLEDVSPVRDEFLTKRGFRLKERNFLLEV